MRSNRLMNLIGAAIVATLLLGVAAPAHAVAAPAHAGTAALRADTEACAKAKQKVKKAQQAVKKAKPAGGKKLSTAKKKLKKAKKAKGEACAASGEAGGPATGGPATGAPGSGAPGAGGSGWSEGRYQGTYAENNADLAFNVVGTRLFTGPFDAFYLDATCHNVDPNYTGPDQVYSNTHTYEPVEATIAANGSFSGQGTYRPGFGASHDWTIRGQIAGGTISSGEFSATYTDGYGNPCSGTTRFTANWYGDYTL